MRRFISTVLAAVIAMSVILSLPISFSAESMYIRKIVSVVYDDSGSMTWDDNGNDCMDKWAYANYAMQAFCGMLNSEDQLFITYMDDSTQKPNYKPEQINLSANGIQNSVDSIRNHSGGGGTPYASVEIAFDKLKSVEDTNPNTQYWLVVITDGVFDKPENGTTENRKRFLNKSFEDYTSSVMPNETHPQITFLGIGNVISPDEDSEKGIYTYSASDANGIIGEMAKMADRISGRTRLQSSDIKQVDDKTIRVSSAIPLLNIVVFAQGSQAKVAKAMYGNEVNIPISRKVELGFPDYSDLVGGAFLLGDSSRVIGSGTYDITFDSKVDLEDVIILFEPALEMRMTVTVNGKEITDYKEFDNLHENDKVSVSCKIYEMGTDVEIDPSLMPPGTKFEVVITEDGNVAKQVSGKDMELAEYILKPVETEIKASVMIEGFNPIEYYERFTPTPPVHQVVYSMTADYGSDVKSVKLDGISSNKDLTVCFTVYADGVAMEDPAEVKALNPVISVSPEGNDGSVVYSNDGKIIFTPNKAKATSSDVGSFDVDVTCTLDDGTTATLTYTVLISEYKVFAVDATQSVKKTEFFDNQVAVSFYITKDGVQLDKSAVEKHISVLFNEEHSELKQDITVAPDGMITVRPYSEEQHTLTFRNWWINWAYYFGLEGDDLTVTLDHAYGSAASIVDVTEEDIKYQLLNVYLPLVIELVILAFLITWIYLIVTKPRFGEDSTLYVGDIRYDSETCHHILRNFTSVKLNKFNKIKKGNGRLKFKKTADIVTANGIKIRADHDGRIICEMPQPWYKSKVVPVDSDLSGIKTPKAVLEYFAKNKKLEINEVSTGITVNGDFDRGIDTAANIGPKYYVIPDSNGVAVVDEKKVIRSGKLFIYVN